jgi:GTPase-activating protein BEM2
VTVDLLEVQMADRTGWFPRREPISTADDVEIQTMYSHILEVEPSPLISELSQDAIYRLLPPGIRSCIRAYGILRKWLISKLVSFQIGPRVRQTRIDKVLRAIEVARLRNADPGSSNFAAADRPCIRSFVEAVLTSAAVSVESRAHYRAWQNVAAARGAQCDSLGSLLRKPLVQLSTTAEPLTVDMSWLLERVLEIISIPDLLTPTSDDSPCVINFDKRRYELGNPSVRMRIY